MGLNSTSVRVCEMSRVITNCNPPIKPNIHLWLIQLVNIGNTSCPVVDANWETPHFNLSLYSKLMSLSTIVIPIDSQPLGVGSLF